jgi:hypothetical protein
VLKRVSIVVLISALLGFAICFAASAYESSADQEIVSSGFTYLGGVPEQGEICKYPDVPEIRVWGDGLAYYREIVPSTMSEPKSRWGRLSSAEMQEVIRGLWLQGLFIDFEVGAPNPAGNIHVFSVQLLLFSHSRNLASDLSPQSGTRRSYHWLVAYLGSKLTVFEPGKSGEPRIDRLNLDRECVISKMSCASPASGPQSVSDRIQQSR